MDELASLPPASPPGTPRRTSGSTVHPRAPTAFARILRFISCSGARSQSEISVRSLCHHRLAAHRRRHGAQCPTRLALPDNEPIPKIQSRSACGRPGHAHRHCRYACASGQVALARPFVKRGSTPHRCRSRTSRDLVDASPPARGDHMDIRSCHVLALTSRSTDSCHFLRRAAGLHTPDFRAGTDVGGVGHRSTVRRRSDPVKTAGTIE